MAITINTNIAATRASQYLSRNHSALQKSLDRLSSGNRITQPADDAGGLAVSMKLNGSISRLKGANNNVGNAISFLQVQDGILESAANIVSRMGELKGLYADVLKSTSDKATYDSEFQDLQGQLVQLGGTKFNGISIFGDQGATDTFDDAKADSSKWETEAIYVTEDGDSGSSVNINKSVLVSAITFDNAATTTSNKGDASADKIAHAGSSDSLADFSTDQFKQALENVAYLRAQNGGSVKRLMYAQDNLDSQTTNMQAAVGRIMDIDVASESANLAKQQILVQASASMVAQANTANNVALMLLQ